MSVTAPATLDRRGSSSANGTPAVLLDLSNSARTSLLVMTDAWRKDKERLAAIYRALGLDPDKSTPPAIVSAGCLLKVLVCGQTPNRGFMRRFDASRPVGCTNVGLWIPTASTTSLTEPRIRRLARTMEGRLRSAAGDGVIFTFATLRGTTAHRIRPAVLRSW